MITQNIPTRLGGRTLVYLIFEKAKYAVRLIVLMIIITVCMSYWSQNMLGFFASHSMILHYFAVVSYDVLKYGWILSGILFVCFGFAGFLEYNSTKFTLTNSALTVSSGTVTHKEITIPYSQVETINISNSPSLRMFGLCSFIVKTSAQNGAGVSNANSEPDAILPVIPSSLAKDLQNQILSIQNPPQQSTQTVS